VGWGGGCGVGSRKKIKKMPAAQETFRKGDEVVLAQGTYQGTPGVFLGLKEDAKWADITERDGSIRSHPVTWLAHSGEAAAGWGAP
jgi:hypothetical protein